MIATELATSINIASKSDAELATALTNLILKSQVIDERAPAAPEWENPEHSEATIALPTQNRRSSCRGPTLWDSHMSEMLTTLYEACMF